MSELTRSYDGAMSANIDCTFRLFSSPSANQGAGLVVFGMTQVHSTDDLGQLYELSEKIETLFPLPKNELARAYALAMFTTVDYFRRRRIRAAAPNPRTTIVAGSGTASAVNCIIAIWALN